MDEHQCIGQYANVDLFQRFSYVGRDGDHFRQFEQHELGNPFCNRRRFECNGSVFWKLQRQRRNRHPDLYARPVQRLGVGLRHLAKIAIAFKVNKLPMAKARGFSRCWS